MAATMPASSTLRFNLTIGKGIPSHVTGSPLVDDFFDMIIVVNG